MSNVSEKSDNQLALELLELIERRRIAEKRECELKAYFKAKLTSLGSDTANLGGILISLTQKSRTDVDKKAICGRYGSDFLKPFEKKTEYVQVDVKAIGENLLRRAA